MDALAVAGVPHSKTLFVMLGANLLALGFLLFSAIYLPTFQTSGMADCPRITAGGTYEAEVAFLHDIEALRRAEVEYQINMKARLTQLKGKSPMTPPYAQWADGWRKKFKEKDLVREVLTVPTYPCPWESRYGDWGDGGKWVCDHRSLKKPSTIVYSVGSFMDTAFELSVFSRLGVIPFTFDPFMDPKDKLAISKIPYLKYMDMGLTSSANSSERMLPLHAIMKHLNHTYVDILKVDCEGCEIDVISDWAQYYNQSNRPPFGQLLMEFHFLQKPQNLVSLMDKLERLGFRMFHGEENVFSSGTCIEGAFIHEDVLTRIRNGDGDSPAPPES